MSTWMTMDVMNLDLTLEVQELTVAIQHEETTNRPCLIHSNPCGCLCHRWYRRACLAMEDMVQGELTNWLLW